MNINEILDKIFEILNGTEDKDSSSTFNIDREIENIYVKDEKNIFGMNFIPEFYDKFDKLENKKELLLSALKSENGERNDIGNIIMILAARYFFSPDEIKKLLKSDELEQLHLESESVASMIMASGEAEKYLTTENIKKYNLTWRDIVPIICANGNIHLFLKPDIEKEIKNSDKYEMTDILKMCINDWDEFLTPKNIQFLGLYGENIVELIKASGNIDKYLTPIFVQQSGLDGWNVIELIKTSGNIKKHTNSEIMSQFRLSGKDAVELMKMSGNVEQYLTPKYVQQFGLDDWQVTELIEASGNVEKYLTLKYVQQFGLKNYQIMEIIATSGNIEKYLTAENVQQFGLDDWQVTKLIKTSGNIEKYLTAENVRKFGLNSSQVMQLIKESGNIKKYLTPESIKEYNFRGKDILYIARLDVFDDGLVADELDRELGNGTYTYENIFKLIEITKSITESNSGRLNRISREIIRQIMSTPIDKQQEVAETIRNIYETKDIPEFAQNFLVFKQLHPNFVGKETTKLEGHEAIGNIPSLNSATPIQRKNIIFSDLLKIAVESNSRNLKEYLDIMEQGDKLFEMFKAGKIHLDGSISKDERAVLARYSEILNMLYNQTSKGKRLDEARKNSGNLEQDLTELNALFETDKNVHMPLLDRIVRTFGYWAGVRNFKQARIVIEEATKQADERNRDTALHSRFGINKADFVKGISVTSYFPDMLQNGIVAKDYLGADATSDFTPLDTDVELITDDEVMQTAPGYANGNVSGKALGKIILVIKNDGKYVETRNGTIVDDEAVKRVVEDRSKIEYFDNNGFGGPNAYGIRTGIGSTNISFIIADRYVDKLGLEIAMNGFYIPIVDKEKKLLYTPEMYDEIRSRMQGLSHYGLNEFTLDQSAKNIGTEKISQVIELSKEEAENKRSKIMSTLRVAIQKYGMNMSEKRTAELLQGTVEVIDTGSTGRGTNLPGDGDFDFMVRLDGKIFSNSKQLKEMINNALSSKEKPEEKVITGKGDFRFKGVSVDGLDEKVDLDLSFTKRTDEIEYTTEECINDRLETIRRMNPEDYRYVVANILLAKTVLKEAKVYKKSSSPEPKNGEKDTRGGLGAVGIENWILQNGGSFEKAARDFLAVAESCKGLSEFKEKYAIWDFGENYMSGENYSHDNFVYNMNETGYSIMVKTLEDYVRTIENEHATKMETKSLGDIVREDISVLNNTPYMKAVEKILTHARSIERED